MPNLTIIANILAEAEHVDRVRTELQKLVAPTRAEAGCITYDLHQSNDDPAHFTFFEIWESRDLWQAHMNAPHLAQYLAATEGAVARFTIAEMSQIA